MRYRMGWFELIGWMILGGYLGFSLGVLLLQALAPVADRLRSWDHSLWVPLLEGAILLVFGLICLGILAPVFIYVQGRIAHSAESPFAPKAITAESSPPPDATPTRAGPLAPTRTARVKRANWMVWGLIGSLAGLIGLLREPAGLFPQPRGPAASVQQQRLAAAIRRNTRSRLNLMGVDLCGANLSKAKLDRATLSGAHLQGAQLRGTHLHKALLVGVDLRGAALTGADLTGAHLSYADLTGADLGSADLKGCSLTGACLRGADLQFARLSEADLCGADLRGVDFGHGGKWVDSAGVAVDDTDPADAWFLSGARYNAHTRWPEGFNPQRHGMVRHYRSLH
jgi:hypothetical protein